MTPRRLPSAFQRGAVEALVIVLLAVVAATAGRAYLASLNTGHSPILGTELLYGPAVMLVAGRGFYQPDVSVSPELRAFLRNETETLDPGALPDDIPAVESTVAAYHRYLLYTVAAFWRLFGMSWTSLELMAALMLGWCAAAAYGLFRLGMGRLPSVALTMAFALSPSMLTMLPHLRDFGKAPFILSAILLLAALIKNKPSVNRATRYAVSLGLVIGVGVGFRQDVIIFIPPAIFIVALALYRGARGSRRRRFAGFVLFATCMFGAAWPMLGRMEGGAQPYHPLVQGYSMKRMANLGIAPASYQPLASGHDNYVFAMLNAYYRRVNDAPDAHFEYNSPGAEAAGRQWLMDMALHFPADILTRGYASVFRAVRYADAHTPWFMLLPSHLRLLEQCHIAFAAFMQRFGLLLGALALLMIGMRTMTAGLGLFIFAVYVFGYTGLQCEFRHAFHLSFVPFWIVGFLLHNAATAAIPRIAATPRAADVLKGRAARWRTAVLFFAFVAVMALAPLCVLRVYQSCAAAKTILP
ncbi:MAG TPA: hypothetical protein ENN29_07930, partial [Candidatus Hydrogenedentes bacterium]|nr:hypothetical protein [Candidatus Hydrogenedentota bacterium]